MGATRLPLLCAFAGGCLSGVVLLLGVWRAETAAAIPAQKQLARSNELLAAAIAASNAAQRRELAPREPVTAEAPVAQAADAIAEPPAAKDEHNEELASAAPTPAGSAVSDVLMDLEAAYRKRLVAAAPVEAPAPPPTPAPPPIAIAAAEPPRSVVAPVVPVALVAALPPSPPAAPAEVAPPAPVAAGFVAPPAPAPPPALVAQNDARAPDIHYGDVNQNTYITNVRQGDVYVMQQQIAMMQYMQLLGAAAVAQPARSHIGRGMAARALPQAAPQYRQFPSTLTNPDNPWGFNFSPPNLVH